LKARRRELKRAGGLAIGITLTSLAIAVVAGAFTVGPDVLGVLQVAWFAAWGAIAIIELTRRGNRRWMPTAMGSIGLIASVLGIFISLMQLARLR
jgi:hypothetical protein